jgi:hypothetical protein
VDNTSSSQNLEKTWFDDGSPISAEYIDPQLLALPRRPEILSLLLAITFMVFSAFVAWTGRYDFLYYFADESPFELGSVETLTQRLDADPALLDNLDSNVLVSLTGIPTRRSETSDSQFAQLVGFPVFLKMEHEDANLEPFLRGIPRRAHLGDGRHDREYIHGVGRLLSLDQAGAHGNGVAKFYGEHYNFWSCSHPLTLRQEQFRRGLRDTVSLQLLETAESPPTPDEIELSINAIFHCENGYIFELDRVPRSELWQIGLYCILLVIQIIGMIYILFWVRRLRAWEPPS